MARHAIASLLAFFRPSVKVKDHSQPTRCPGDRQTVLAVAERLVAKRVSPLDPVYLTPGHLPVSEVPLQVGYYLFQRLYRKLGIFIAGALGSHHFIEPKREQCHLRRIHRADLIPTLERGDRLSQIPCTLRLGLVELLPFGYQSRYCALCL